MVIDLQDIVPRFHLHDDDGVNDGGGGEEIKVFVLDRPNPIGGVQIEGPALDPSGVGFTGYLASMPIRHGLTMGELAQAFNGEKKIGADLTVVAMRNWRRDDWLRDRPAWTTLAEQRTQATLYPSISAIGLVTSR
jgi:uncharacterized protein YbbC (DUF1343 family)